MAEKTPLHKQIKKLRQKLKDITVLETVHRDLNPLEIAKV